MTTTKTGTQDQESTLERVTVNLTQRSTAGLYQTIERTGDNKTDVINRHIQEGAYLEDLIARGGKIFLQEPGEKEVTRLTLLF